MKVCIAPNKTTIEASNGIGRVVHAQYKHLPKMGVELVGPEKADVIAVHTQQLSMPRVDVVHLHGMYWTAEPQSGQYNKWHYEANKRIVETVRRSQIVTVPSDWVARPFQRDMRINPVVIGHGIDFDEWELAQSEGYVLWNKNRAGDVCNPQAAYELAQQGIKVATTFAPPNVSASSMTVLGVQPADRMKILIQHAEVYLATVKETFGIGTLEALACGVPVLGWDWGGTADIVQHKVNGYLVTPGDYEALIEGYHYIIANRKRLAANAREWAKLFDWPKVIGKYVEVYEQVQRPKELKVSIVITSYNYGQYLETSVNSALKQSLPVEVVVVDDGSTDATPEVAARLGVRYIRQENAGVASARNHGVSLVAGDLIICLDADDALDYRYAETLQKAFMQDRGLGVAYTGLSLMTENSIRPNQWPPAFKWEHLAAGGNPPASCIPSAAMFRKTMWERSGGYRQQYAPAEDTEFWLRGLSLGFTAQQVVPDGLFHYRAHNGSASRTKKYRPIDAYHPWVQNKQYPLAAPASQYVPVHSYSEPLVTVIIPVGPGHERLVERAIESVIGQSFRNWEMIVVTDYKLNISEKYPFVRVIAGEDSAAKNRNLGIKAAKAPTVLFLDADDYLAPNALQGFVEAFSIAEGRYIYSDWLWEDTKQIGESADFSEQSILTGPRHPITALVPTSMAHEVMFDETLTALEDWDFFARLVIAGCHGQRLTRPLVVVSRSATGITAKAQKDVKYWQEQFNTKFAEAKPMSCCGSGGPATLQAKMNLGMITASPSPVVEDGEVRMEFIGEATGAMTYGGRGVTPSGRAYRGGNNSFDKYLNVDPKDVDWLESTTKFKRVVMPFKSLTPPIQTAPVEEVLPPTPAFVIEPQPELPLAQKNDSFELELAANVEQVKVEEVQTELPIENLKEKAILQEALAAQKNHSYKPQPKKFGRR